jgi:Zn-finger nucleic acid-binding protein
LYLECARGGTRFAHPMQCPRCEKDTLKEIDRQGISIDRCEKCRGVWLDRGELEKLTAAAQKNDDDEDRGRRDDRRGDDDDDDDNRRGGRRGGFFSNLFDFD